MVIRLENLSMRYGDVTVFESINAEIEDREFVALVGPSGCGKSTLLNIIAGTAQPTTGQVHHSDGSSKISYVFQDPRLLDWRTVRENLRLALRPTEVPEEQYDTLIADYLETMGLGQIQDQYPRELSGGMRSRIGLIRGLIVPSNTILMDEPLGNVDELTARSIREELLDIWENQTIIYVTHDVFEAVYLSDRILVMDDKPTRELKEVPVMVDRPRDPTDDRLFELQNHVYDVLPE